MMTYPLAGTQSGVDTTQSKVLDEDGHLGHLTALLYFFNLSVPLADRVSFPSLKGNIHFG